MQGRLFDMLKSYEEIFWQCPVMKYAFLFRSRWVFGTYFVFTWHGTYIGSVYARVWKSIWNGKYHSDC